ncbi:MAG: hypothetical protein AAGB13_17545 [Cyanobacteria bacterium P01_F01_bin.33]
MNGWRMAIFWMAILVCSMSLTACSATVVENTSNGDRPQLIFQGNPPEWAHTATSIMTELEQWRGLPFQEDLQVTFQPPQEPGLNGWYDSETKQLVVTVTDSEPLGRGVLLHEMFHALQDRNFDLYQLKRQSAAHPDYEQAVSAIIEGEAMLAVSELMNYDFLAHAKLPAEGEVSAEFFEKVFLYGAGMKFILAVRDAGGWEAVDAVFRDPPRATSLIFQPDRYLAGEREVQPTAPSLRASETLQSQTVRGAYQVQLLLARQAETRPLLGRAAEGYVADTLNILKDSAGETKHQWAIEFSNAKVAADLVSGLTTALARDERLAILPSVSVAGNAIVAEW